jgi:hypothetical protein
LKPLSLSESFTQDDQLLMHAAGSERSVSRALLACQPTCFDVLDMHGLDLAK